jgi:hypothetical protein
MDARILGWLEANRAKLFASPRSEVFGRRTEDFEIVSIKSDRVYIRFAGTAHVALPLIFSMFDRVLDCLQENQGKPVRLGAKVSPPYENDTLEAAIWKKPFPTGLNSSYKAAPHICDILVLSGIVEYVKVENPLTTLIVQGAKLIDE